MTKKSAKAIEREIVKAPIEKPRDKVEISIPEQIYKEMIELLVEDDNFDKETIDNLRILTQNGYIRKPAQVVKALKKTSGVEV